MQADVRDRLLAGFELIGLPDTTADHGYVEHSGWPVMRKQKLVGFGRCKIQYSLPQSVRLRKENKGRHRLALVPISSQLADMWYIYNGSIEPAIHTAPGSARYVVGQGGGQVLHSNQPCLSDHLLKQRPCCCEMLVVSIYRVV